MLIRSFEDLEVIIKSIIEILEIIYFNQMATSAVSYETRYKFVGRVRDKTNNYTTSIWKNLYFKES